MEVRDFGVHDGPLVLFGGPCSNLHALEALARAAGGRPAICTGDVVGHSADPGATVALIRRLGWPVVAGNCERQFARGAGDCDCGFAAGGACDEARAWMAGLPDAGTFVHLGRRYAVIHGCWTSANRFLWPSSDTEEFVAEISALEAALGPLDGIVAGHSGIAFHRRIGRHQWINAGAVGLPPHDGRRETRYAVLDRGELVIHRLAYDHAAARAAMEKAGLTGGYHDTLTSGIWPSEEMLPPELRR